MSIPKSPTLLPCNDSVTDIPWLTVLSKSIPNSRPIASFARHTVLDEVSTSSGIGRYWSAVRDAIVVDVGGDRWMGSEPSLWSEAGDPASRMLKYPPSVSALSFSVILRGSNAPAGGEYVALFVPQLPKTPSVAGY